MDSRVALILSWMLKLANRTCIAVLLFFVSSTAFAAHTIDSVTLNGGSSVTVSGGDTIAVSIQVTTSGNGSNDDWESTEYTLDGSTTCVDTTNYNGDGTYTEAFNITAPLADGTYSITFTSHRNGGCVPGDDTLTLTDAIIVSSGGGATPSVEWRLDESSWDGTPGEVKDSIGALHGTAFNATTVTGQVCKAGDLSANSTGDYLSMDNGALNGVTDFSISVWGKTSNSSNQALFSASSGSQHNELIMWFPNATTFTPYLKGSGSGSISITNIADNNWHHFMWTRNGAQNCFYVDSVLQGCSSKSTQALSVAAGGLIIGQEQDSLGGGFSGSQDWEGLVDEPLIFQTALTQSEVTSIYNNQLAGNGWDGAARNCPSLVAEWRMDELQWSGSSGEVIDASGNGHNATTFNGLNNDNANPAIAGNPGTCRYGDFDGSNDYIELPASLPDLSGSFTVLGWINARELGKDQRILADDENNSGGFAFSLGDGGDGKLRFFSRDVSPVVVDTQNAVINQNSWHFVAAVHDAAAKTRQIYVDGVAVTLNTGSTSSTYTGTWGTDSGRASIGGETDNAGGEAVSNWRFNGLIDEMRVYQGALSAAVIGQIMNETHPCPGVPRAEWRFDESTWAGAPNEVMDSSGNSYHGTAINTSPVPGLVCNAADLTTNSNTDYLSMNNGALNGVGDFTLSIWSNNSNNSSRALVSGSSGSQHNEVIMWFPNSTTFEPYLKGSISGGNIGIPTINDNQWHHYVWTRSGAQNCLYRDGVLQSCVTRSSASLSIAAGGLILGQEQDSLGGGFSTSQDWEGLVDEAVIFDSVLSATDIQSIYNNNLAGNGWDGAPRTCAASSVDHYEITHVGTGGGVAVTCEGEQITVNAHDSSDAATAPGASTSITIDTNTGQGDWAVTGAATGTFDNGTANDGIATYTFGAGETSVVFVLTHTSATVAPHMDIDVLDNNGVTDKDGDASEDAPLAFADTAFRFYAGSIANNIGNQISAKESNVAPGAQIVQLRAVQTNTDTGACEARITGVQTVELGSQCNNPGTCKAGQLVTIDNATGIASNPNAGVTNYTNVNLDFGVSGTATFTFDYSDAGLISLHARKSLPAAGDDPAITLSGTSNTFVVRPFAFGFPAIVDGGGNANPGGDETGGAGFVAAAENFNVTVTAYRYQAGDDTNSDGQPDINADVTDNGVTPNFQSLTSLSLGNTTPSGGGSVTGTLSGVLALSAANFASTVNGGGSGSAATSLAYSEVGSLQINAASADYLGDVNADIVGVSPGIGRIYPDHFILSSSGATPGCGAFSYMGQPFSLNYTLLAQALGGGLTQNYAAGLGYVNTAQISMHAEDQDSGVDLGARLNSTSGTWVGGQYVVNTSAATFNRAVAVDGPFPQLQMSLRVSSELDSRDMGSFDQDPDTSGNCAGSCTAVGMAGLQDLRYGRLHGETAYGPETLNLAVPIITEYYDSGNGDFVLNSNDACTSLVASQFDLAVIDDDTVPDNSNDPAPGVISGITIDTGLTNGSIGNSPFNAGNAGFEFSSPGADNTSKIEINLNLDAGGANALPWLKFNWDGAAGDDNPPMFEAVFGQYRGNDRVIYWREVFN